MTVKIIAEIRISAQGSLMPGSVARVWGEGMDQLDPGLDLTPTIKNAFAAGSPQVNIVGPSHHGSFNLVSDYVNVGKTGGGIVASRYLIYEFQGWKEPS